MDGECGPSNLVTATKVKNIDDKYRDIPNLTQEQAIIAKDRCWLGWLSFWLLGTGVLFTVRLLCTAYGLQPIFHTHHHDVLVQRLSI